MSRSRGRPPTGRIFISDRPLAIPASCFNPAAAKIRFSVRIRSCRSRWPREELRQPHRRAIAIGKLIPSRCHAARRGRRRAGTGRPVQRRDRHSHSQNVPAARGILRLRAGPGAPDAWDIVSTHPYLSARTVTRTRTLTTASRPSISTRSRAHQDKLSRRWSPSPPRSPRSHLQTLPEYPASTAVSPISSRLSLLPSVPPSSRNARKRSDIPRPMAPVHRAPFSLPRDGSFSSSGSKIQSPVSRRWGKNTRILPARAMKAIHKGAWARATIRRGNRRASEKIASACHAEGVSKSHARARSPV